MKCLFVLLVTLCVSCPACSFWLLSHMRLSSVAGRGGASTGSINGTASARMLCEMTPGLSGRQRRLCERQPDMVRVVMSGAQMGITECQYQFERQRWNCTTISRPFSRHGMATIMFKMGSREAAFVYAISSAGVVHAIARSCASGTITDCTCGKSKQGTGRDEKGDFIWSGCSDNVRFAAKFARRFVDSVDRRNRDPMALMNLHNFRAGRRIVRRSVQKECKCHGVSGSCTTRTCWKAVDKFRTIGNLMYQKYRKAYQVRTEQKNSQLIPIIDRRQHDSVILKPGGMKSYIQQKNQRQHRVRKSDLVFVEPSPDYCLSDLRRGSVGTDGRLCNRSSQASDNCNIMCCGRGYNTRSQRIAFKCQCRFTWCCKVECKMCSKTIETYSCKSSSGTFSPPGSFRYHSPSEPANHDDHFDSSSYHGSQPKTSSNHRRRKLQPVHQSVEPYASSQLSGLPSRF